MGEYLTTVAGQLGISMGMLVFFLLISIWSAIWKLLALWKSARKGSIVWFLVLGITNTVGILPIFYIYVFSKMAKKKAAKKKPAKKKAAKKKKKK